MLSLAEMSAPVVAASAVSSACPSLDEARLHPYSKMSALLVRLCCHSPSCASNPVIESLLSHCEPMATPLSLPWEIIWIDSIWLCESSVSVTLSRPASVVAISTTSSARPLAICVCRSASMVSNSGIDVSTNTSSVADCVGNGCGCNGPASTDAVSSGLSTGILTPNTSAE